MLTRCQHLPCVLALCVCTGSEHLFLRSWDGHEAGLIPWSGREGDGRGERGRVSLPLGSGIFPTALAWARRGKAPSQLILPRAQIFAQRQVEVGSLSVVGVVVQGGKGLQWRGELCMRLRGRLRASRNAQFVQDRARIDRCSRFLCQHTPRLTDLQSGPR